MRTIKLEDYLTTIFLMAIPVIVALQDQIMLYVPPEYAIVATIIFGILSQVVANMRVADAKERYFEKGVESERQAIIEE